MHHLQALREAAGAPEDRPTLLPVALAGSPRAVALLPGSFDPPHVGHLALAEAARAAGADLVLLVYAARTLPKEPGTPSPLLDPEARLEALHRIVEGRAGLGLAVASHGLLVDQAEAASALLPGAELSFAVGSDKVVQVLDRSWYREPEEALDRLFSRAALWYATRPGDEAAVRRALAEPANARWRGRVVPLSLPSRRAGVSSRRVRELVRDGADVAGLVPSEVLGLLRE